MPSDTSLFFLLKGDHPTLLKAELEAIMEAERIPYTPRPGAPQISRCRAPLESAAAVTRRAYYTRLCAEELTASIDEPRAVLSALREIDFGSRLGQGERFGVRLRRIQGSAPDVDLHGLRGGIIRLIRNRTGAELDLEGPDVRFVGLLSGGRFYFGRVLAEVGDGLGERRASRRPFFHPSTLQPKLAGCMVNLTRVRPPEPLLDPFCGAGALLIEAGLLGCHPVGVDLSPRMVEGAGRNLSHFGVASHLIVGDARRLPLTQFGAVATDPPYGRIASTRGADVEDLYLEFMDRVADLLASQGYLCLAAPRTLRVPELAEEPGFKHVESHLIPIHDRLTREVAVFRRG